ncbi:MAG: alpha/beta hydrolase [Acidobacteriota bacterium]|nr:alpha/beta hydrolase [Acidobacteriota bacterium]
MRAREPDREGYVERDGVRLWHEVYGAGETTIMLIPGWSLPLRSWKAQIPYLSRHFRIIAFDPRGTGRSDRPGGTSAYALREHTADAVAVMDAAGARSVVMLAKSRGAQTALALAGDDPARVEAVVAAAPMVPLSPWLPLDSIWSTFEEPSAGARQRRAVRASLAGGRQLIRSRDLQRFSRRVNPLEAADRFSRQGMLDDYDGFTEWFVTQIVATDPHATKQIEDTIAWNTSTGAQAAADSFMGDCIRDVAAARALCGRVSQPVLVIHGECDLTVPLEWGTRLAELTGGRLFVVPGAGHLPGGRYPVVVNLAVREFVDSLRGRSDESAGHPRGAAR